MPPRTHPPAGRGLRQRKVGPRVFTLRQTQYLLSLVQREKLRARQGIDISGADLFYEAFEEATRMEETLQAALREEEAWRA